MATIKTTYVAADGKEFTNAADADRHDLALKLDVELNTYVATLSLKSESPRGLALSRNRVKRNLIHFLSWRETGVSAEQTDDADDAQGSLLDGGETAQAESTGA